MLSVIIPAYNEEQTLSRTVTVLSGLLSGSHIEYELLFINDGSTDRTWEVIGEEAVTCPEVKGIGFSRNFGKEAAIFAGLERASGDCAVIIDCDLQHPPEKILEMYRLWQEGYEVVEAVKADRGKENPVHGFFACLFYRLISKAIGVDMTRASDYKLLDRKAIDSLLLMPERNVFFRGLSSWIGFRTAKVEFEVREREAGESKWTAWALINYAVKNITSFSALPLQFITVAGLLCCIGFLILAVQSLYMYISGRALEGFTTVILVMLFIGGGMMVGLGIIGYYLSRIYEEIKGRPRYIVSGTIGYR